MNSIPIRVIQYWAKPMIKGEGMSPVDPDRPNAPRRIIDVAALEFRRYAELEISLLKSAEPHEDALARQIPIRRVIGPTETKK